MKEVYISKSRDFCGNFVKNNGIHYQNLIVYAVLSFCTNLIYSNEYIKYTLLVVRCRSPPERFDFQIKFFRRFLLWMICQIEGKVKIILMY